MLRLACGATAAGSRRTCRDPAGRTGGGRMNMKKILASVRIALRALQVNRLRSSLTMLGIIIGVAAVISMVAVGSGATARIQEQIASNVIIVLSGSITSNGIRLGSGAAQTLSSDDAKAIATECPAVAAVAPAV